MNNRFLFAWNNLPCIITLVTILQSCSNPDPLPEELPRDLIIEYECKDGMDPVREFFRISLNGTEYERDYWGCPVRNKTWTDSTGFKNLYRVLKNNLAGLVKTTTTGIVVDKGLCRYSLAFGGKKIEVRDDPESHVEKKWADHYKAIMEAIFRHGHENMSAAAARFAASVQDSSAFSDSLKSVNLRLSGFEIVKWTRENSPRFNNERKDLVLIPGKYKAEFSVEAGSMKLELSDTLYVFQGMENTDFVIGNNNLVIRKSSTHQLSN